VTRAAAERLVPWLLFALAAAPRLIALDLRPLHHDEGSNAIFLLRLVREGIYRYDPTNYHGPLLFYLSALPLLTFGPTTIGLRIVPALLGAFMAPLAWCLRREIGRAGAAAAGLLLASSPALVYYARDNIHETYFASLTLLLVVGIVRGPAGGSPAWTVLAGIAAGALLATKETAVLLFVVLSLALAVARGGGLGRPSAARSAAALVLAGAVAAAFYTNLGRDPAAILAPLQAVGVWGRRAVQAGGHEKAWSYYLFVLAREEWVVLLAGVAGGFVALRRRDRFGAFLSAWSAVNIATYSAIPYKTPWLVLNLVLPLSLLSGVAFDAALATGARPLLRRVAAVLLPVACVAAFARAIDLAFVRYDDPAASPFVYVQTRREALQLVSRIEEVAAGDPAGRSVAIDILSPDYLPLNWYLRDFDRVAYFGRLIDHPQGVMVIARCDAAAEVASLLAPGYSREEYELRPGVRLCLFLRPSRGSVL
jgi:uncharacterized protein (TIGR03663 family)